MRSPWFNAYENASAKGARMHVSTSTLCNCSACQDDRELRLAAAIDHSQPQAPKVGGAL